MFFQGHAAPGIYARAFLEGRPLSEGQLEHFRMELSGPPLARGAYPPTRTRGSMPGLLGVPHGFDGDRAVLNAIYQAHFNRYVHNRGIADTQGSRAWCFVGDGGMRRARKRSAP